MRTISVKEAALALGITPRAVSYRLEKGQLKGNLTKNEATGVPEWRIYPNKEILSALRQATAEDSSVMDFEPIDVIDAESIDDTAGGDTTQPSEARPVPADFQTIVEQCVRPLVEEVKAQALALAEKDRIIEDQSRQLRLLPDFQKRAEDEIARAEEERKAAQLRALEIEALNKQVTAMKEEKHLLEAKADEAASLAEDLQSLKSKVEELQKPWWKKFFLPAPPPPTHKED
ncbi:MAG: hypothetical protein K2X93_10060 [Candidatus Obscuribacterales bacterium]|nr:hypothetical protein [Candidatus Obscuribacterales bacterium]